MPAQTESNHPILRKVITELDWDTIRIYFLTLIGY
jgi:hypothetical protein